MNKSAGKQLKENRTALMESIPQFQRADNKQVKNKKAHSFRNVLF